MLFRMKLKLKFIHNESRQHYTLSALDLEVLDLGVCMPKNFLTTQLVLGASI